MPKVKTIAVTYGRKHNLGDYSSAHIEITVWADLEEGEDEARAAQALWEMAKNNVKAQLAPLDQRIKARVEDIYMGLPVDVREQMDVDFYEGEQDGH